MKHVFLILMVLFTGGISGIEAQITQNQSSVPPSAEILTTVVYQEGSPLRIDKFVVVKTNSGQIKTFYTITNTGTKEISHYTIARWYSDNTGYVGDGVMPKLGLLGPQQSVSTIPSEAPNPIPVAGTSFSKLKKIALIMVVEIRFADGAVLSFEREFKALESHLEGLETVYDRRNP